MTPTATSHASNAGYAAELTQALRAGHELPVIETGLMLSDAEKAHAQAGATAWWYGAMEVPYEHRHFTAFGGFGLFALTAGLSAAANHHHRSTARRLASPQWRNLGYARVIVTSDRTLIALEGEWMSLWHANLMHFATSPTGEQVQLTLDNGAPYAIAGPSVPYLAVALMFLVQGEILTTWQPDPGPRWPATRT